ncbi:MAG: hypothetical protein ACJAUP_002802 [Cellvibrionaceae bacterium]|jgi:hypothetical protein
MSTNPDRKIVHIEALQDKKIAELNSQLNKTYIPYGKKKRGKSLPLAKARQA